MNLLWKDYLRFAAEHSAAGAIRRLDGVEAAWVNSLMPFTNAEYLTSPVADEADLRRRLRTAVEDAKPHGLPWALFLYEPFVESVDTERAAGGFGLVKVMGVEVMTADIRGLAAPARELPEMEYRRVASLEDAKTALDINMHSYGLPEEMGASALAADAFYGDARREFGYLGLVDGVPVSTAAVIEIGGWLYVALVATEPERRQKGYAEAVMRHALAESARELGITRTSLDATAMGAPVYSRMGYARTGERWTMYAQPH